MAEADMKAGSRRGSVMGRRGSVMGGGSRRGSVLAVEGGGSRRGSVLGNFNAVSKGNSSGNSSGPSSSAASKPAEATCGCFKPEQAGSNMFGGVACAVCFNPLFWFIWFIDFVVWFVYFILVGWLIALVSLGRRAGRRDGAAWRSDYTESRELIRTPAPGVTTAWECFDYAFKKYARQPCMGTRTYLGEWRRKEGDKIAKKILGETTWMSYAEVQARAEAFGRGLLMLGMTPSESKSKAEFEASSAGDTLLLWEDTCADWMTTMAGAHSQSLVVATSYATLGIDGVVASIGQCQCPVVVCNRNQVATLLKAREDYPQEMATVKALIYTNLNCGGGQALGQGGDDTLRMSGLSAQPEPMPRIQDLEFKEQPATTDIQLFGFEEVIAKGRAADSTRRPPSPDNIAVVMYTSGSTGKPKGVVIGHKNLCASVAAMREVFSEFGEEGAETYLAYLPAAHILELCAEVGMLSFGCQIGYADPRSIASTGACRYYEDSEGCTINFDPSPDLAPGAIQEFKPSIMAAVPKIWEILKKGIEANIAQQSCFARHLVDAAFAACKSAEGWRICPLLRLLFSKKIGAMMGGRLKVGISGGGPLSAEVQTFARIAMGVPIIQGYALTETCCAGCVQSVMDLDPGVVGPPIPSVEIKLEDCKEITDRLGKPYMSSDTSHWDGSRCAGRGEVLIRGPSVSLGYYCAGDDEEEKASLFRKNQEEFSSEAPNQDEFHWFHTGDIGLFTPNGRLKLIDRKKNLIKLKGGEYIAVEAMEAIYSGSIYVDAKLGGIMVYGDGDMDKPVALMQAELINLKSLADDEGIRYAKPEELCTNSVIVKAVLADLLKTAKGKLSRLEMLGAVALIPGTGPSIFPGNATSPWTPENGFLTASNKIDRNAIKNGKVKDVDGEAQTSESFHSILQPLRIKVGASN